MNSAGWMYLLYFAVFILLVLLVPPLIKRFYYQRLMQDLNSGNFAAYSKHIDSFLAKVTFSAFERESMRLSLYKMQGEKAKADDLLQFMEHMRLNKKQRAQLGEEGFYVYLDQGKIKKARHMVDLVKEYGSEAQARNLEIQYSILLKKEAKYIDEIKSMHKKLAAEDGQIPVGLNNQAGMLEYLIALQYSYENDNKNKKEWARAALEHLKGTPQEDDIQKLLRG